jgi:hypothetical protein
MAKRIIKALEENKVSETKYKIGDKVLTKADKHRGKITDVTQNVKIGNWQGTMYDVEIISKGWGGGVKKGDNFSYKEENLEKVDTGWAVDANKIKAFDFTMNQDLDIGDKVKSGRFEGKIVKITRVQDVYADEEDFEHTEEVIGHSEGLSWQGNKIMTVHIEDSDGAQKESFVYEVEKLNDADLSDVSMPPQKGETLASNKIKIDDVIQERMDLDKVNKDDEQSDWQYYATVLNVGNETIQLYNERTNKKWKVLPGDLYEDIDTGVLRMQPKNKVKSTKIKASEENKYLTPGGRNGLADVMVTYIFGDDYKSAYESLVRQMSDDDFLSGYNYIKRMSWDGEEGSEEENMLNEAEKEFFQE